ncbi:BBSome-interacting protein 1 [Chamberlinius hualienensis]
MENRSSKNVEFREILPRIGFLYTEHLTKMNLCKPKLLPLKSFTLEKLETIQKDAQNKLAEQQEKSEITTKDQDF